jgi:hypothetical protein
MRRGTFSHEKVTKGQNMAFLPIDAALLANLLHELSLPVFTVYGPTLNLNFPLPHTRIGTRMSLPGF